MSPLNFGLAAAVGNVLGAYIVVRHVRRELKAIDAGIGFGAGFMLGVLLLGVLPEVFRQDAAQAAAYILAGYLVVHLAQHVLVAHFHFGEETHHVSAVTSLTALFGLSFHAFFDGVAIASGFLVSGELGLLLFLAVLVHKVPEGVTMASIMLAGGQTKSRAIGSAVCLGVATMLGTILTEALTPLARHGLALSAGVTLYVAASNLVPEFQQRGRATSAAFFGGIAAYLLTERLVAIWVS